MASGIIKSYTVPSGSTGAGAYWSFEWTSTKKSAGVSIVSWNLYTRGRTTSPRWLDTSCVMNVGKNGTTTELYNENYRDGAVTENDSFANKWRASGTFDVTHNANGYASFTIDFDVCIYTSTHHTTSETAILDNLPTKATIMSATPFDKEHNPVVTYSNGAGTSVTSLGIAICASEDGTDTVIGYKYDIGETDTKYYFDLSDSEFNKLCELCSGNSTTVYFCLKTVIDGSTYYDYKSATFSIVNGNPIVTGSVVDSNTYTSKLTGNPNTLVKYFSNATASMTAEAQDGASLYLDSYIIRNGEETGYGDSHTFDNVESNVFAFSAEDSRGNVGTATVTPTMVEYVKLTCNIANNRPDALGNMTVACSGNYFNNSFGAESNTLQVKYKYKVSGEIDNDNWSDMTVTINGNSYYASADFVIPDFDQSASYSFETRAIDKLTIITSSESAVKSVPIFHWGENDFVFEVPVTFNASTTEVIEDEDGKTIDGNLTITGDLRLKGSGNFGNKIYLGDGSYVTISEPYDDSLVIAATTIDLQGTIKHNGVELPTLQYGFWYPTLSSSAISSYTTQNGWYQKMGQIVTVGFFVKATCSSGYDSTNISISGLPFSPMASAAGGGMCSGANVTGGYNFQCFVAESSGNITTRIQDCNNTSSTNLSTSASGCSYPIGGGELTLSGTITFMANS